MAERNGAALNLFENHEERIQRLEEGRLELVSQIAEQTSTLKSIERAILDGNRRAEALVQKLDSHILDENQRLAVLENDNEKEEKKTEWFRKIISGILVAVASAAGVMLLERIFNHPH